MNSGKIIEKILSTRLDVYQVSYIGNEYRAVELINHRVFDALTSTAVYKDIIINKGIIHKFQRENLQSEEVEFSIVAYFTEDEYDEYCKYKMLDKLSGVITDVKIDYSK
jgi:hypothetical protein